MKRQVVVIHGGETFETYDEYLSYLRSFGGLNIEYFKRKGWKSSLQSKLGDNYDVIAPQMPNKQNAKYLEWNIWFEKLIPSLQNEVILIGHSLGGIFLAKYLSENQFPLKIKAVILVAAPFDAKDSDYTLADFVLPEDLSLFEKQGGDIILYQSKDDPIVPYGDVEKYKTHLNSARMIIFNDREHFGQEEFPELIEEIKKMN